MSQKYQTKWMQGDNPCTVTTMIGDFFEEGEQSWYSFITVGESDVQAKLFTETEVRSEEAAEKVHRFVVETIQEGAGALGAENRLQFNKFRILKEVQSGENNLPIN